jgi:hypothetical protein
MRNGMTHHNRAMNNKLFAAAAALGVLFLPSLARSDDSTASSVKAIDTDCNAISLAVMALKPVHVVLAGGTWKVMNEGDFTVAEKTHSAVMFVDAYKQGKNYALIHSHTFGQNGAQRATELCFRQSDGTLERAKQAETVNALAAADATAYFASDGTLLEKTATYAENDPAVTKKVADLPYFSSLP